MESDSFEKGLEKSIRMFVDKKLREELEKVSVEISKIVSKITLHISKDLGKDQTTIHVNIKWPEEFLK